MRTTQTKKAGLILPVARFHRKLKNLPRAGKRVSKLASVYSTAVIEYLLGNCFNSYFYFTHHIFYILFFKLKFWSLAEMFVVRIVCPE
jgi:hypothetical protein